MYLTEQHDLPRHKLNPEVIVLSTVLSHSLHLQGNIYNAISVYASVKVERRESIVWLNGSKQPPLK